MSMTPANQPMPLAPPADLQAEELDAVLAWPLSAPEPAPPAAPLRQRLMARVARSLAAEAGMVTVRQRGLARHSVAPGVQAQTLYAADTARALRPGEPLRCQLLYLAPGTTLDSRALDPAATAPPGVNGAPGTAGTRVREWLVLAGALSLHQPLPGPDPARPDNAPPAPALQHLALRDYHRSPVSAPAPVWHTAAGAQLFLRESTLPAGAAAEAEAPSTVRDADAGWPDFGPGIQRRVLWHGQGQASMLYLAAPGAHVPNHAHGHDEECLMVQGELYLDDVLLQGGDYQLAPAGTGHRLTHTDTGVVIYAHGDLDLQFA